MLLTTGNIFIELEQIPIIEILNNSVEDTFYTFGIPTYKRSKELDEALTSIYNQKSSIKYNVIVSDNNPMRDDETELMMKSKYGNKDNVFYFKNVNNIGATNNWNRLFQYCRTKYLIMLHDDDVLLDNYLERIEYFVKRIPDVSALNCEKITWNGKDIIKTKPANSNSFIRHSVYTNLLNFSYNTPSGCLFNVDDIKQVGGYNDLYGNAVDSALMMQLFLKNKVCVKTVEPLMLYRWGNNASTKFEVLKNLLENDLKLRNDVSKDKNIPSYLKKIFEYFDVKIRLRSILKINGVKLTFNGYSPGGNLFVALYKVFTLLYRDIYIFHYCKEKV